MLETELFALLEHTADAAYTVTEDGTIRSWNRAAQRLFGHAPKDVVGRHIDDVLDAFDSLGTEPLAGGADTAVRDRDVTGEGIPAFDLEVRSASGSRLWVNVSTIVFDNRRTGHRLLVRLARDVTRQKLAANLFGQMVDVARQVVALPQQMSDAAPVETLTKRERAILKLFAEGNTSTVIARRLRISAHTLRNHLHHINRKLRTHSRLEAVTHAQRRGLLD